MTISNYSKLLVLSALICIMPVSASYASQYSNTRSSSGWFSTQNVLVGAAIGVLAFTGYKLYNWYLASKRREEKVTKSSEAPSEASVELEVRQAGNSAPSRVNPVEGVGLSLQEKVEAIIDYLITAKSNLSPVQRTMLRDAVMRNDIVRDFISGENQGEDHVVREMIAGVVNGSIQDLFPKQSTHAFNQQTRGIIEQINRDKGNDAKNSVEYVVHQLKAQVLSYHKDNKLPVIRIKAPDQRGLQCGDNGLANLVTVHKLLEKDDRSYDHDNFIEASKKTYRALFELCQAGEDIENVGGDFLQRKAEESGLRDIIYISKPFSTYPGLVVRMLRDEEQAALNSLVASKDVPRVFDALFYDQSIVDVVINSGTHWTAANAIFIKGKMKTPVIVLMDSRNNTNPRDPSPENYNETIPLQYINHEIRTRLAR